MIHRVGETPHGTHFTHTGFIDMSKISRRRPHVISAKKIDLIGLFIVIFGTRPIEVIAHIGTRAAGIEKATPDQRPLTMQNAKLHGGRQIPSVGKIHCSGSITVSYSLKIQQFLCMIITHRITQHPIGLRLVGDTRHVSIVPPTMISGSILQRHHPTSRAVRRKMEHHPLRTVRKGIDITNPIVLRSQAYPAAHHQHQYHISSTPIHSQFIH